MIAWRRFVTVPGYALAWLVWISSAVVWVPLFAVVDAIRGGGGVLLRCALLVAVYLTCEVAGVMAGALLWVWAGLVRMEAPRWQDLHFRLEAWWGTTLFRAVKRFFDLRVEVDDQAQLERGPYLLLLRHASSGDTLLASALVSHVHGMRLRYVLKRELLWDPCLDIVGNRIPNVFVDRFTADPAREVDLVRRLANDLGPHDGVLIYPEGTRFSAAKRERAIRRFEKAGDSRMAQYARTLTSVLPPRPGGALGLLDAAPDADVVICSHTGFEGAASLAQIWRGELLHRVIRVQFRRIPRRQIPHDREERTEWLLDQWSQVSAWVDSHR